MKTKEKKTVKVLTIGSFVNCKGSSIVIGEIYGSLMD